MRNTMWERCGDVRSEEGLKRGLEELAELRAALPTIDVRPTSEGFGDLAHVLDLRASLATAEASLLGALERNESRGSHNRSDYPNQDPALTVNFHLQLQDGEFLIEPSPVPPVPSHLREWTETGADVDTSSRLLE
jgi:succinate dehydrogenase / fumarate reductase flavoprotein subunit